MQKIAFVSTMEGCSWGGSEPLWSQAALNIAVRDSIKVYVSVKSWPQSVPQIIQLEDAGCIVKRRTFHQPRLSLRILRNCGFSQPNVDAEMQWLRQIQPDLVVISQGSQIGSIQWMERCQEGAFKYVVVTQAGAEHTWPVDGERERYFKGYGNASACYFVSQRNLELTKHQIVSPIKNAKIVRNPFNVPYDIHLPWPTENHLKIACVARLEPESKGQDILFNVLSHRKWRDRPLQISLFGAGKCAHALQELKSFYNLENVHIRGFSNSIESIWKEHHALILPSRYEGLPLAIVEAMLCARPCIVTDVAGNSELVEDEVTGFVAEAASVKGVDKAMERAWQRRGQWQSMGKAAARSIRHLVPPDPAKIFADEIVAILRGGSMVIPSVKTPNSSSMDS